MGYCDLDGFSGAIKGVCQLAHQGFSSKYCRMGWTIDPTGTKVDCPNWHNWDSPLLGPTMPVITSAATATGTQGTAFTFQIAATGFPVPTITVTGALPPGLSFNSATKRIEGTPTAASTASVTIDATNSEGTATQTFTFNIAALAAPVITSSLAVSGTQGTAFTYLIVASGNPTSYSATGLPAGLSFVPPRTISGTPTAVGPTNVTITATNAGGTDTKTLVITIAAIAAPVITSSLAVPGTTGTAFTYQITASGATPITWGLTGTLPTGLSFNTANGRITGTPTVVEAANVTITATNAGGTDSQTLVITIVAPSVVPVITTSTLTFTIGTALTAITGQLAATGSPTSWATVPPGAIPPPAGLTFNTTTGQLTGTPTGPAALTNVTFTATNADGTSAQKVIAITVEAVVSPAYYGLLGQNNTQPTWVPNLGQPTEAVILALPVAGGADGTAGPAAVPNPAVGNQWIVPNVPGHFGYCFAYPDTLPAASELWSFAASANLLSGATPLVPITVVVNGVNYRVYFQRMMVPYAGYLAQGMRLTI